MQLRAAGRARALRIDEQARVPLCAAQALACSFVINSSEARAFIGVEANDDKC